MDDPDEIFTACWDAVDYLTQTATAEKVPVDTPKKLLLFCQASQEYLTGLATKQDQARDPFSEMEPNDRENWLAHSPDELVRALWNIAFRMCDSTKGRELSSVPQMPLGQLTAHDAIVHLQRLVVWCEGFPIEVKQPSASQSAASDLITYQQLHIISRKAAATFKNKVSEVSQSDAIPKAKSGGKGQAVAYSYAEILPWLKRNFRDVGWPETYAEVRSIVSHRSDEKIQ